jgi:hypothetical protein
MASDKGQHGETPPKTSGLGEAIQEDGEECLAAGAAWIEELK